MASVPNDMSKVLTVLGNQAQNSSTYASSAKAAARNLGRASFTIETASVFANAANAIAANAGPAVYMPRAGRVLECKFKPHGNATENVTNYAVGRLNKLPGNGTVGNAAAQFDTRPVANGGGGNVVTAQTYSAVVVSTEEDFAAQTWLSPQISMVSSGVAFPAGSWTISVEWQGVDTVPV